MWVLSQPVVVCITLWDKYFLTNAPVNEVRPGGMLGGIAALVTDMCGSGRGEDRRFLLDAIGGPNLVHVQYVG